MVTACSLLVALGLLGAFDIGYFHRHTAALTQHRATRVEAWVHVARGVVYSLQFALVPRLQLHGGLYLVGVGFFALDVGIAMLDVWIEPRARASLGGLPRGEGLAHIVLSVIAGAYLYALATATLPWAHAPSALVWHAAAIPRWLGGVMTVMAAGCAGNTVLEALELVDRALPAPRPLHVAVRLRATVNAVWDLTQDPGVHPTWDHRFSRIAVLADRIDTGTTMRYEKSVLGVTIRGFGRYKLHRPLRQSTFEFWSDDPRSLIARGVGLWRYTPTDDGQVEFATSYTYAVRWGLFGRWVDRLAFRPAMQWYTEQSFRRLARVYFPRDPSRVVGARGRKPVPLGARSLA